MTGNGTPGFTRCRKLKRGSQILKRNAKQSRQFGMKKREEETRGGKCPKRPYRLATVFLGSLKEGDRALLDHVVVALRNPSNISSTGKQGGRGALLVSAVWHCWQKKRKKEKRGLNSSTGK